MTPPDPWLRAAMGGRYDPFPWQSRLLRELLAGALPRALDLPTGLGKTSVMAIWLVARARAANHLPRRLVYVVDRRAIVDQATTVAQELAEWVEATPEVQHALGVEKLPISTLRGQHVDNKQWLDDPSVPSIVVGTVDMIGSRLLFSGYACSRKMRPYHAGFLGCDTLIVLDEAHLVPPFEHMLEDLALPDLWPEVPLKLGVPARLLSLSATGRTWVDPFQLDEDDEKHDIVRRRLTAEKALEWHTVAEKADLADALAEAAWTLATHAEGPQRILVFSHKPDIADKARAALQKRFRSERGRSALPASELLVGGRRIRERSAAEATLKELGFLASDDRPPLEDHAFLFTTSAGEVGVDLDAHQAVADVVAWERMVQRLGRVNRRGDSPARVLLIAQEGDHPWRDAVKALVDALPQLDDEGRRDGSPSALGALRKARPDEVAAASTPEPLRPPLSLPLLEAWSMTTLDQHTGRPEVAPWLRGWDDDEDPTTAVLWRRFLPAAQLADYLEAAPPHGSEALEAPSHLVCAWLLQRATHLAKRDTAEGSFEEHIDPQQVLAAVLDSAGELERTLCLRDLDLRQKRQKDRLTHDLSGRQLLVDHRLGGLSEGGLLDGKHAAPPPTVDDPDWMHDHDGVPVVPHRSARRPAETALEPSADSPWIETARIPWHTAAETEEVTEWLVVERWKAGITSEHGRAAGRAQALDEHQDWAGAEARRIAAALRLPERIQRVLVVAARLHDEGKRAARWQRAFSAPRDGVVYAKTPGPLRVRWLDGYRHELGSLPYARRSPELQALPADDRELVLHLIAAHHGSARPTIRTTGCDDAPPSLIEARAREVALRFVHLQSRWGPWRLAWLESLLRAADQTASRKNSEEGR